MSEYPIKYIKDVVEASPSSPSVRFTALVAAIYTSIVKGIIPHEKSTVAAVNGNPTALPITGFLYTKTAAIAASPVCPIIFWYGFNPRLLWVLIFRKSSRNPTSEYPSIKSTATSDNFPYPTTRVTTATGIMKINPPIVGVPSFALCCET